MDLIEGVKLVDATGAAPGSTSRILLSSGTTSAPAEVSASRDGLRFGYEARAIVPAAPWREPAGHEHDLIWGLPHAVVRESSITVISLPEHVLGALEAGVRDVQSISDRSQANEHFSRLPGLTQMIRYADNLCEPAHRSHWPRGALVNAPGLPTVTIDNRSALLVGLHVDNWINSSLTTRHACPNRIVANLGQEDRYLLYINLPLIRVWQCAYRRDREEDAIFEHDLVETFARKNPTYPALKLRISPGEAYIAPTDNIIHDGSTVGMKSWDLYFSVVGYFTPPPFSGNGRNA